MPSPRLVIRPFLLALSVAAGAPVASADVIDMATLDTSGGLMRVHGSAGIGSSGLPVAGGVDCNGDGHQDTGFSAMRANPFGRSNAGEAYFVFGDGTVSGTLDTAVAQARILVVTGAHTRENAGSEVWMDDLTGDGIGDLLIARQNHDADPDRLGAGAVTIVVGGPEVSEYAEGAEPLDLASPPESLTLTTLVGAAEADRLGMWIRTGDIDGDGVHDLLVGADQEGPAHQGGAWVVRGGSHLAAGGTIDLASFGATAIEGHLAHIGPSATGSSHAHLGATVQVGDLDGNGRAEVLVAAALNRAGGGLQSNLGSGSHGSGQEVDGTLYIVWDDSFPAEAWPAGYAFAVDDPPGARSVVNGSNPSQYFGEELLAGQDFDGDGDPDLFVGDITGDASGQNRPGSGHGYVFYDAAGLKDLVFDLQTPPPGLVTSLILGAAAGDLAADTAVAGDFDGDGIDDLSIASPHHDPFGRDNAGAHHVIFGKLGPWPAVIDLANLPDPSVVRVTELFGALGETSSSDDGDTLGYSAASGYVDGDHRLDLVTNEMVGNGFGGTPFDVGNLVVISGAMLAPEPSASGLAAAALGVLAGLAARQRARRQAPPG